MRTSGITTLVCLAVAVTATPTPFDQDSIAARDVWTSPARREAFIKRIPEPEPTAEELEAREISKRSPFSFDFLTRSPLGTITLAERASGSGLNARFPFFFKRGGNLSARDIEELEARKADLERREAELAAREAEAIAKREAEEQAKRDAEEQAKREAEELAKREAEALAAREAQALKKRAAFEDIEAREAELEQAKREYEEMQQREFMAEYEARGEAPFSFDVDMRRHARDFDFEPVNLGKRQFGFLSNFINALGNGTAGGGAGGGTNTNTGFGRLTANAAARLQAVSQLLRGFGFNFRRDELEAMAKRDLFDERDLFDLLDARDSDFEPVYLGKRQFGFLSNFINALGNGTTSGGAGGGTNTNTGFGRLTANAGARLQAVSQLLRGFGFNFRRDELETMAKRDLFEPRGLDGDDELEHFLNKRQFGFLSNFINALGNGTTGGGAGGGTNTNTGFGRLTANAGARLQAVSQLLRGFGFNFRREDLESEMAKREPMPLPTPFGFKEEAPITKREPFGLDAFVKAKRGY